MARRFRRAQYNALADMIVGANDEVRRLVQASVSLGHQPTLADVRVFYAAAFGRQLGEVREDVIRRGQKEWMPEDASGRRGGAFSPSKWLAATLQLPQLTNYKDDNGRKAEHPVAWNSIWADDIRQRVVACMELARML